MSFDETLEQSIPSTDPISPADLRPGQRVRITRRNNGYARITTWEGVVRSVCMHPDFLVVIDGTCTIEGTNIVTESGLGNTQTIEVIE